MCKTATLKKTKNGFRDRFLLYAGLSLSYQLSSRPFFVLSILVAVLHKFNCIVTVSLEIFIKIVHDRIFENV